jgi:hypothetical protein
MGYTGIDTGHAGLSHGGMTSVIREHCSRRLKAAGQSVRWGISQRDADRLIAVEAISGRRAGENFAGCDGQSICATHFLCRKPLQPLPGRSWGGQRRLLEA